MPRGPLISMKYLRLSALLCGLVVSALAAPFGKVVPIGGHVADLALDSRRNVLYIANFGANRIDVMSLADTRLGQPIYVSAQPATLAVSPDGRFLVIGHYQLERRNGHQALHHDSGS